MAIKDDILALKQKQLELKAEHGRYIQMLPTPADIPAAGVVNIDAWKSGEGNKPEDETETVAFVPTNRDYQFTVHVWKKTEGKTVVADGVHIIARRDLGDDVIETITLADVDF